MEKDFIKKYLKWKGDIKEDHHPACLQIIVVPFERQSRSGRRTNNAESDQEEEKELVGSLAEKKLPTEGCNERNGERDERSGQKKISDDRRQPRLWFQLQQSNIASSLDDDEVGREARFGFPFVQTTASGWKGVWAQRRGEGLQL
ncbi:hypothetical protein ANN_12723 [Periplaneta americana]|uniref:Uncharacterized protein n=1 Tax=Periplaneta americana TaxID=6978 RepID=A0ABQ8THY9_PERAM|nr:hypothetical protein ANN_12723 [Periplaneta americana]